MNPDIITRLKQGEQAAFKEIVDQWQDMVYNTALSIVQDESEAEDLTQDVFLQVYESLKNFRQESSLSTWIYRITVRKALDIYRKKLRRQKIGLVKKLFAGGDERETGHFNHPGVLLDKKEDAAVLFRAISSLPEKQKVAFILHKLEGLSYQQIAEIMSVSLMSVESLQVRAKNNLRQQLQKYYEQHFK